MKHGMKGKKFYKVWENMKGRCLNENHKNYHQYGGRGISICVEWMDFENFKNDMLPFYKEGLSLDRVDNDKGYFPENCKWATKSEQNLNTRRRTTKEINGVFYRRCSGCDRVLILDDFYKSKVQYMGRCHWCKKCMVRIQLRNYRQKHDIKNILQ